MTPQTCIYTGDHAAHIVDIPNSGDLKKIEKIWKKQHRWAIWSVCACQPFKSHLHTGCKLLSDVVSSGFSLSFLNCHFQRLRQHIQHYRLCKCSFSEINLSFFKQIQSRLRVKPPSRTAAVATRTRPSAFPSTWIAPPTTSPEMRKAAGFRLRKEAAPWAPSPGLTYSSS